MRELTRGSDASDSYVTVTGGHVGVADVSFYGAETPQLADSLGAGWCGYRREENFEAWWARNCEELKHLHPMLAEQWVYRHWDRSEFACLPIETISWELVKMSGEEILATVKRELGRTLDADTEFENHQGRHGAPMSDTAVDLEKGTWTYPIVALSVPTGWCARDREYPDARMMLVEGYSRHAYLYALHAKGLAPPGPHEVFVIRSPLAEATE